MNYYNKQVGPLLYNSCTYRMSSVQQSLTSDSRPTSDPYSQTCLLQGGAGQVRLQHLQPVLLEGQVAHVSVCLPVVEGNRRQVVEGGVQVVGHMTWRQGGSS